MRVSGRAIISAAQRVVLGLTGPASMNEAALATFCSDGKYEECGGCARRACQSPDQCRRSADGRRPARSGADPVQGGRSRVADRAVLSSSCIRTGRPPPGRASKWPSPTMLGCRLRPRSASCASGSSSGPVDCRLADPLFSITLIAGEKSESTRRDLHARLWRDNASA